MKTTKTMNSFLRAVASEEIKHRRTLSRWLLVTSPAVLVACYSMVGLLSRNETTWQLFVGAIFNWWVVLWVPLGAALLCALSSALETRVGGWVMLRARPISPATLYAAKLTVLAMHALAGTALLLLVTIASGAVLIGSPVPVANLVLLSSLTWLAALPLLAIGLIASVRAGLWASIALGAVGFFVGVLTAETANWVYVPWAWPVRVSLPLAGVHANGITLQVGDPMASLAILPPVVAISLIAALSLAVLGALWFNQREVR